MEEEKKKRLILIVLGGVGAFIVILIIILGLMSYLNGQKNKVIIDGAVTKLTSALVQFNETGKPYICAERLAPLLGSGKDGGYSFFNGESSQVGSEDRTKGYVKNKYEVADFTADSNIIYKSSVTDMAMYDAYYLRDNVKNINGKLYVPLEAIQTIFNVKYSYNSEKQILSITTLPALVKKYNEVAVQLGYTSLAEEFNNQKALVYDMLVVLKDRKTYGVLSIDGTTKIGAKYEKIEFMESGQNFIVTSNKKLGVLSSDATTKINIIYDELKLIDNEEELYLAKSNSKYGVLDVNGNVVIYFDYNYIGIQNQQQFPSSNIKNPYILYDNCIPVCKDGKWGMFDVTGKMLLPVQFSGFGCISSTQRGDLSQNVLLIPASEGAEGIVVNRTNSANVTTYGIVSTQGKLLTSDRFSKIYAEFSSGTAAYYMVFGNTVTTVKERINIQNTEVNGGGTVQINGTQSDTNTTTNGEPILGNNTVITIEGTEPNTTNEITRIQ